jgi:serpin B
VNEKGTEAAAATAAIMMCGCRMPMKPPREVNVDHPFLFTIVEKKSCSVLFFGRVSNPKA